MDINTEWNEKNHIQLKIVEALSRDYLNVYLINPKDESFKIIKLDGYITDGINDAKNNSHVYKQICEKYINSRVHPDDRKMMKHALNIKTVLKHLKDNQEYKGSYRTIDSSNEVHYYQYKYMKMEGEETIIAGFQNVDDIISSERKQAEQLSTLLEEERIKNTIIESLSTAYLCIYYLDLKTETFQELSTASIKEIDDFIGEQGDAREKFITMSKHLVKPEYKQAIIDFTELSTVSDRLKHKNSIGIHFDGPHAGFCEALFVAAERDSKGKCTRVLFTVRSIQEEMNKEQAHRKQLQKALDDLNQADTDRRTDFLTGLRNRQDMFGLLNEALSGKMKIESMFMMDIDNFKMLNDTYGHSYGDECLKKIGTALNEYGKKNNLYFCRYGGEEMLGISFKGGKKPPLIAKELVKCVSDLKIKRDDSPLGVVTISLGYTTDNNRYEKMLDKADTAMYAAKRSGKNKAVSYEEIN